MRERYPDGSPAGDPGEQADDSLIIAPEAAALLGDGVLQEIGRADHALTELDRLAAVEDPFAHDRRGSEVDLGFLKPEFAVIVANYHTAERPFKGIHPKTVAIFGRKIARRIPGIHNDIGRRVVNMEPVMTELGGSIDEVASETPDNLRVSMVPDLQELMDTLLVAYERSPSRATITVVENAYAAAISGRDYAIGIMEHRGLKFIPGKMGMVTDMLRSHQTGFKEVVKAAGSVRSAGTGFFKLLSELITIEQTKQAAGLLGTVDAGKQKLPEFGDLEGDERDAAIAAERYLTAQADRAAEVIKRTNPSLLKNPELKAVVGRLLTSSIAQGQETGQPERQVTIGHDVLCKLTEAKNILRGGRRLKPDDGQTERDIKRTADELHALKDAQENGLLDPEESGVIVAMITGKFKGFDQVFGAVKKYAGDGSLDAFPADRLSLVYELDRFDLTAALTKIGSLLDDPDTKPLLERVLGAEKTQQVQATLSQA